MAEQVIGNLSAVVHAGQKFENVVHGFLHIGMVLLKESAVNLVVNAVVTDVEHRAVLYCELHNSNEIGFD